MRKTIKYIDIGESFKIYSIEINYSAMMENDLKND
jgi:hypothetical protein